MKLSNSLTDSTQSNHYIIIVLSKFLELGIINFYTHTWAKYFFLLIVAKELPKNRMGKKREKILINKYSSNNNYKYPSLMDLI